MAVHTPRLLFLVPLTVVLVCAQTTGTIGGSVGPGSPQRAPSPQQQQQPEQKDEKPATVEGRVTSAITGAGLKNAQITLYPAEPGPNMQTPRSATTGPDGKFVLTDIPSGKYRITAERNGFVRAEWGARGSARIGTTLALVPGQEAKQIDLSLQPHAVIAGRVVDEDGEPLSNVFVSAGVYRFMQGRRQLLTMGQSSTNDLGEYRIFALPAGKYLLTASPGGSRSPMGATAPPSREPELSYAPTYYPGTVEPGAATPVTVAAGRPVTGVDIRLLRTRAVRVRGRVLGLDAASPGRANVMLLPRDSSFSGFFGQNTTFPRAKDGRFEISGVIPGSYYVIVQSFDGPDRRVAKVQVDVGTSDVEGVELHLTAGSTVSATIRVEGEGTDVKPSAVRLYLEPKDSMPFFGGGGMNAPRDDGTMRFEHVPPGVYRIRPMGGQNQLYVKSVQVDNQPAPEGEVTINPGSSPNLVVTLSSAGGQISGVVKGEKDSPFQGASVVLVPNATEQRTQQGLFKSATTDQYGKFTLTAIAPGQYKIFAWDTVEPGQWMDPDFLQAWDSKGRAIGIQENSKETLDLTVLKSESNTQ